MPTELENVVQAQRDELVARFATISDLQVEMFQKALKRKYTPKEYTKDVSKLWAENLKGFAELASGWLVVAQAVANAPTSE